MKPHTITDEDFINSTNGICYGLFALIENDDYYGTKKRLIKKSGRKMGDILTVAGCRWPRLLTPCAVDAIVNSEQTTFEHPLSKQQCGERFIRNVLRKNRMPTETEILKFLRVSNRVIKSTPDENQRLRPFQNDESVKTWMEAYKKADIKHLYIIPNELKQFSKTIRQNGIDCLNKISLKKANNLLTKIK